MTCSICFNNFGDKEISIHYASGAPHKWHKECLQEMVKINPNCPLRCGYRYSEKDFFSLQERITNARKTGISLAQTDFVLSAIHLLITTLVAQYGVKVFLVGLEKPSEQDVQNILSLTSTGLAVVTALQSIVFVKYRQNLVDHEFIRWMAFDLGITPEDLVSSMMVGGISTLATGIMVASYMDPLTSLGCLIPAAVGGAFAGISAIWKRFKY